MATYLSRGGRQALSMCINHVLNNAVDKHTKAIYKRKGERVFYICVRLKRNGQSLKLLRCLSIHDALQSSLTRGPASRLYG